MNANRPDFHFRPDLATPEGRKATRQKWDKINLAMKVFIHDWEPVGKKVKDLTDRLGPPDRTEDGNPQYWVDGGVVSWGWQFTARDGVIVEVTPLAGD